MRRSLFAIALLGSTASTGILSAQEAAHDPERVREILDHLETFMPAPSEGGELLYLLAPTDDATNSVGAELQFPDLAVPAESEAPVGLPDALPVAQELPQEAEADAEGEADTTGVEVHAGAGNDDPHPDIDDALDQRLGSLDFGELARDARVVPLIGQDMAALDKAYRGDALHDMARRALDAGNPAAFRKVMATYVDPAWQSLDDAETALNMIAWMPDTAAFLGARLSAARFVGARQALSAADQSFLWKDLRARVERVGRADYQQDLLLGMLETGNAEIAIETVRRFAPSALERITTLVVLIDAHGTSMPADTLARLVAEIETLRGDTQSTRHDPNAIALAYWRAGLTDHALQALDEEADPALRLRTRFDMLLGAK